MARWANPIQFLLFLKQAVLADIQVICTAPEHLIHCANSFWVLHYIVTNIHCILLHTRLTVRVQFAPRLHLQYRAHTSAFSTTCAHNCTNRQTTKLTMRKKTYSLKNLTNCTINYIKFFTTNDSVWCLMSRKMKLTTEREKKFNSGRREMGEHVGGEYKTHRCFCTSVPT